LVTDFRLGRRALNGSGEDSRRRFRNRLEKGISLRPLTYTNNKEVN